MSSIHLAIGIAKLGSQRDCFEFVTISFVNLFKQCPTECMLAVVCLHSWLIMLNFILSYAIESSDFVKSFALLMGRECIFF